MDKNKEFTQPKNKADVTPAMFLGTLVLGSVLTLVATYATVIIFRSPRSIPNIVGLVSYSLILIGSITSIVLTSRGRQALAVQLELYLTSMLGIITVGLTQGRATTASFSVLFISAFAIIGLLPQEKRRRYFAISGMAFALIWVIEWFNPSWRLANEAAKIGPVAVIVFAIILVALVIRQTWGGSLQNKLLIVLIGTVVVSTVALGIPISTETQRFYKTNLEREFSALTVSHATQIGELLNEQVVTLTTLTLNKGIQQSLKTRNNSYQGDEAEIQALLDERDASWRAADKANNNSNSLVQTNLNNAIARELSGYQQVFPNHIEVFVTDIYGGLAGTTNRTSDYYQADEGWWQSAYNNGQGAVYISEPEYDESADAIGVQIALPIRDNDRGEIVGILRTTYLLSSFTTILSDNIGTTGKVEIYFPGEVTNYIYEGNLEQAEPGQFETLQTVAGQGMVEIEYKGELSVVTQAPVRTLSGNSAINDLGWIVVFHQNQDEALLPVNSTVQGLFFIGLIILTVAIVAAFFIARVLSNPIANLTNVAEAIAAGNLNSRADATSKDEIGKLASMFNIMTSRLQETLQSLEQRVEERTRALSTSAEVSRRLSTILDLNQLVREVVEQVKNSFNYYHAQIYLIDEQGKELLMTGGTGDAGQIMLARGHKIPVGKGLVGLAAETGTMIRVGDTTEDPDWLPNPLLPETKSEVAVPIVLGEKVLGVLDVQQNVSDGLSEGDAVLLQSIAYQVAVAVRNAQVFSEAQQQAEREALINEIGRKIQNTASVEQALQVAARELGQALGARDSHAVIDLQGTLMTKAK